MKQYINRLTKASVALMAVFGLIGVLSLSGSSVSAATDCDANPNAPVCQARTGVKGAGGDGAGRNAGAFSVLMERIINLLLFIIGAVAVIMIIIGGIRYTTSGGDASQAKGARDTILYAVVGLVVAIMAYAIVNFVLTSL